MPEIFKKDCKIRVIEYGVNAQDTLLDDIKNAVFGLLNR